MRGLIVAGCTAVIVSISGGVATIVSSAVTATEAQAQVCFPVGQRVCGFKNGRWRNYRNRCYANRARARPIRNGQCRAASNCASQPARAVCGTWRGRRVTFRNLCYARRSRATNIRYGRCRPGGGGAACNRYAAEAIKIVRAIRSKGCRVPGTWFYSTNRNTQLGICRQRTPNQRAGVLNSMRGYLQRCRGQGGGNRQAQCNNYANGVMGQVARWRGMGCPTGAPIWNPNRQVHFNLCMSGGAAAMRQQSQARANDLRQGCSRN